MTARRGRLIAIEGSIGPALTAAARRVVRALRDATGSGGFSVWDASGIFTELSAAESDVGTASARTLILLYAADLAFRIRWHIVPALDAGESVVAAPYVESAKALSVAAGLPKRWLDELFAFAPKPSFCYRIHPARRRERIGGRHDYAEWFAGAVAANGHGLDPKQLREKSIEYLNALEARRRCKLLTPAEVNRLAQPPRRRR
jgi:thymidylate kinase